MSSSSTTMRRTRSTNIVSSPSDGSTILEEFQANLHSPSEFIHIYNQYSATMTSRSTLIHALSSILALENVDEKIRLFILDCFIAHSNHLSDVQFKQDLLPFIKQTLSKTDREDTEIRLSTLRLFSVLVEYRSNILTSTLAEWLSCLLNFLTTQFASTWCAIYGDLTIDLLSKTVKQFTPLSKEIVDILSRSSSVISTDFLNQLKSCIKNTDDIRSASFAIHLWQALASLLSRLLIRGHSKGNEMLTVMEEAFTVSNYSVRSAAFTSWSSFMSHVHHVDDVDPQQLNSRLLKLFLAPFLPDYTSKSKSASMAKCQAWITLISIYPRHIKDVILPFLSFAFGNHPSSKSVSTTTAWWPECRQIGAQFIHDLLIENTHGEYTIRMAGDEVLNYLFDSIVDQLLEYSVNATEKEENALWLASWNAYLTHLIRIFKTNDSINESQRVAINTCLLTRIEQLWIDSRIETRFVLKLFESFEQSGFPLAIETVLRDSSTRTKTLSAAQIHPASGSHRSLHFDYVHLLAAEEAFLFYRSLSIADVWLVCLIPQLVSVRLEDKSLTYRTTLSDQYLHMMLEHAIRLNDEDQTHEETYLHAISYLIDTLSKTSDENFCYQTSSLLLKCSVELFHQPLMIPSLFWHIWFRCSTHLISILNRSSTFELNNKTDNQKQETSIELLLRPFAFNDIHRLDYSYTLLWTQLFKALCRLALINHDQSKHHLIHLLVELLRNEPAFEQAINDQHNQRLLGFLLIVVKTLLKTFSDIDLSGLCDRSNNNFVYLFSNTQKRSLTSSSIILCFTQLSVIINHILQRLLSNNENNTQYMLVCCCLLKSNKVSSTEQTKLFVFTYVRDLIVDLFNLCKTYSHLETVLRNLTQLIPFLYLYEQSIHTSLSLGSSPISIHKQQTDNVVLNKILSIIALVFEPSNSSSLLQLVYPILILAFQHNKTIMRNKARKCWNETFGRMTLLIYPNELRLCLRDLKEKDHLLLPCFLADHDNSNTAGSGAPPSSTDESQLSQQVDIATPLIAPTALKPQSSPACFLTPTTPATRSTAIDKNEPVFVPIVNNINYNNQLDAPVVIGKRSSSTSTCLTEKQKEKLRSRHMIPLLCDDSSNTQSNSNTLDTPTIEGLMRSHQLRQINYEFKQTSSVASLSKPTVPPPVQDNTVTIASVPETIPHVSDVVESMNEDLLEETTIAKKLRRSHRSSVSVKKNSVSTPQKKHTSACPSEVIITTPSNSDPPADGTKQNSIKSILKRLSPTKPRSDRSKRVVFHDEVKVLVFASPCRRDLTVQQKRKGSFSDRLKSPTRIIPRENLPLRKQPTSARRLSAMPPTEQIVVPSPVASSKTRSSKLFHPNDAIADWTQTQGMCQPSSHANQNHPLAASEATSTDPIFPPLIDCEKPVDTLLDLLSDSTCSTNMLEYFRSVHINTVGDVARCTPAQIDNYPIASPKWTILRKALSSYQEHLTTTSSKTSTPEEIMIIDDSPPTTCSSVLPVVTVPDPSNKLYDVETLINSLDCERLYLHDGIPPSPDRFALNNQQEFQSTYKRCLSPMNEAEQNAEVSPKKPTLGTATLGDCLQKALDVYRTTGTLSFNDDYIELVRQLLTNPALTHLEQLHLKTLFLNH